MAKTAKLYELVLVLRPSLSEADRKKLLESVKGSAKGHNVVKEDDWGQKPLAYAIDKEVAGHYHLLHLESEAAIPADFEQRLLRNDNVLRHLLLRIK